MSPAPAPPAAAAAPLRDGHGRAIRDVRVSVTDRCNFRCQYCMPAEGLPWLERDAVLSFDEIARVVARLARMGVRSVRLTGGEPLARRDLAGLVGRLARIPGVEDLSLTTNGYLLERQVDGLVASGLRRLNVSLDALGRDAFFALTRRDALPQVLAGLAAAERHPDLRPIKVNAVALRGITEGEVLAFAELARRRRFVVRFIEFMPLDGDRAWDASRVLSGEAVRALVEAVHPLVELDRTPGSTARRFAFADGSGELGFVSPVTEPFCGDCDRIRLTADGGLRTCLFSRGETDLRGPLRRGVDDAELDALVRAAVRGKELKHRVGEPGWAAPARSMSQIGG